MSGDEKPAVRLTPPPRARSSGARRPPGRRDRKRTWTLALTGVVLAALVALAGVVVVWLPGWVDSRPVTSAAAPPAESTVAPPVEAVVLPPEDPGPRVARSQPEAAVGAETPAPAGPRPASAPAAGPPATGGRSAAADRPPPGPSAFERALGQGLAALAADDPATAKEAFARALALVPDSAPAAAGLARAQQALRWREIAHHRAAAAAHIEAERWAQALGELEAALALDATLEFARAGAEQARRRAALDERLTFHLERPERLSSAEVHAEASALLAQAQAITPAGPRLREQSRNLAVLLERAATPIEVVLESDELTDVTVYRVGQLGRFRRRSLQLLPGTYTVIGRRSGYRDVRLELVVREPASAALVVRCEEKI